MIMKAQSVYKENDTFTYFGGDNQMKFLRIMDPFFLADIGIHIGDNRKEFERKQRMDQMGDRAFGQSQDPEIMLNLIKMWNADSATEAEAIFRTGVKALQKMREENMKAAQEQEQAKRQSEQATRDMQQKQHEEKMQNNLDVAYIYADNAENVAATKEGAANSRKAAEIDRDIIIANSKKSESK